MKFGILALTLIVIFAGIASALTTDCADGTKYFKCSVTAGYVGFRCGPSGLVRDATCKCEDVSGYMTQGTGDAATCVVAKCDDNSQPGQCAVAKPKVCVGGSNYIDNSTKCGCPTGKQVAADKVLCEYPPCSDAGVSVRDGTCSPKLQKKCVNGQLVDKASECGCKNGNVTGETCTVYCTDGTAVGSCSPTNKPKKCTLSGTGVGYFLDDAGACGCPEGKLAVGKLCTDSVLGALGAGADTLGGAPSNDTGAAGGAGAGGLSCCCLPTALIGLVGGFAVFRKKQ